MSQTTRDLELKISEAHKALAIKEAADARARLRDEFAMAALPAFIAREPEHIDLDHAAQWAYLAAEAMLEARNANR